MAAHATLAPARAIDATKYFTPAAPFVVIRKPARSHGLALGIVLACAGYAAGIGTAVHGMSLSAAPVAADSAQRREATEFIARHVCARDTWLSAGARQSEYATAMNGCAAAPAGREG